LGVDYTRVGCFFLELPSSMTTLTWRAAPTAEDPALRSFAGKTFRTIDRLLSQREAALAHRPDGGAEEERRAITALRGQWVHQLLDQLPFRQTGSLWVVIRRTASHGPKRTTRSVTHVEAWTLEGEGLRLVERRTIGPRVKRWTPNTVDYFDLVTVNRALADVIRTYAPDLLARRCGTLWRSRRRPAGWPAVTRYAIPWLYDYLRPFYGIRHYTHGRARSSAGHYPLKLRQDVLEILRCERPDLAGGLALAHVTAAIQYHLRKAPRNRPMGRQLGPRRARVRGKKTR
jgi:hypothetical protein